MAKVQSDSRNQLRMLELAALRDVAVTALSNPIVSLVGGVVVVSVAEKADLVSKDWAAILRGGVVGIATMQALAPVLKESGWSGAIMGLVVGGGIGGAAGLGIDKLKALSPGIGVLEGTRSLIEGGGILAGLKKIFWPF